MYFGFCVLSIICAHRHIRNDKLSKYQALGEGTEEFAELNTPLVVGGPEMYGATDDKMPPVPPGKKQEEKTN